MKIHVMSDIHIEFGDLQNYQVPDCDVVVLAGDVHLGSRGLDWIVKNIPDKPVIYIEGNHEGYNHDLTVVKEELCKASGNIYFLDRGHVMIYGVMFIGATLWTDFKLYGEDNKFFAMQQAAMHMNDYRIIRADGKKLTPGMTAMYHERDRLFIETELEWSTAAGPTVVVTHHLPSEKSLSDPYRQARDDLNPAYASNLEYLMTAYKPALWIHGHVHESKDYMIGETRVLCNPRGYYGHALNPEFDQGLVVEV